MFDITDGPWRWSGAGLPPFTGFYLYLTLKTADRERRLWFHSFDRQKSNIPLPQEHSFSPFVLTVTPTPPAPCFAYFYDNTAFKVKDPLRTNGWYSYFGQKNQTPVIKSNV